MELVRPVALSWPCLKTCASTLGEPLMRVTTSTSQAANIMNGSLQPEGAVQRSCKEHTFERARPRPSSSMPRVSTPTSVLLPLSTLPMTATRTSMEGQPSVCRLTRISALAPPVRLDNQWERYAENKYPAPQPSRC